MSHPFLRKVYTPRTKPPQWQQLVGFAIILLSMLLGALLKVHSIRSETAWVNHYHKAIADAEASRLNEAVAPQTLLP